MKKIVNRSRILMVLAGIILLIVFIKPIWTISLHAPQYPEGVHLYIFVNKLGGKGPATLQNINILNHYIGMKYIIPEDIPELKYFPYVLVLFILAAFLAAWINKKSGYATWTVIMVVCLFAAMYDFYLWEYDYGHSLDPNAIMKFEGESFQPPLIGKKNLLNFVAISMPNIGGVALGTSVLLGVIASYLKRQTV